MSIMNLTLQQAGTSDEGVPTSELGDVEALSMPKVAPVSDTLASLCETLRSSTLKPFTISPYLPKLCTPALWHLQRIKDLLQHAVCKYNFSSLLEYNSRCCLTERDQGGDTRS